MRLGAKKGEYGYISAMKVKTALITLAIFLCAISVYILGLYFFREQKTMVGIVTVLICIPASMALVRFIMFMRFKEGDPHLKDMIDERRGEVPVFYDSIITTSDKSYPVNAFIAASGNLIGCTLYEGIDVKKLEEHIKEIFRLNKYKDLNIKVFTDSNKFFERLDALSSHYEKTSDTDKNILHLVGRISL